MTTPPPPFQSNPQQTTGGYSQQHHPHLGYAQTQYPPSFSVPTHHVPPTWHPQLPRKPRFGLGARIATIAGVVVMIVVMIVVVAAVKSGSTSATPAAAPVAPAAASRSSVAASVPATAAVVPTVAPAPPAPAKAITARDWAKIAKNPDAHVGESIIVYGQVKQFDAATGTSAFRANVDGVKHSVNYGYVDYETNTVLAGEPAMLTDLVQDDLFRAEVVVTGSLSYDTTLGGTTTVPQLSVTRIVTTGTAK